MRLRLLGKTIALAGVLLVVAAACSSNKSAGGGATSTAAPAAKQGGQVVFGAEQWPECVNPITSCASATWTWYSVLQQVLPQAAVLDLKGNFVASPVLVELPTLDNGGISQNPFTLSLKISPKAVWEDGSPITSKDIDFTNKAILNTTGAYTTAGYNQVDSIDTTLREVLVAGGQVATPRTALSQEEAFATFLDPAGNLLGLYQEPRR